MSLYGCNNKPRPTARSSYVAQIGWKTSPRDSLGPVTRTPICGRIKSAFGTTECQYTLTHAADPECSGCVHRSKVPPEAAREEN
jgi:hypothetical protein